NRPRQASTSPLVSTIPPIGVSRRPRGCSAGKLSICARTSGEALSRNHCRRSALTAADAWLRAGSDGSPPRTPAQWGQPQFHCGGRRPAAEPSTRRYKLARLATGRGLGLLLDRPGRRVIAAAEILLIRADLGIHR